MDTSPADARFHLARKWLLASNAGSVVMGLLLHVLPGTAVMAAYDGSVARAFHGTDALPAGAAAQHAWSMGLVGAAVVGWGVVNCFLLAVPFARREPWSWWALACGLPAWMALDAGMSVVHGAWGEVVFVAVAAVLMLPALLLSRSGFAGRDTGGT